jgi:VPDSG-CTERM motif
MFMKITLGSTHLITVTGLGVFLALLPLQRALAFSIDGGSDYAVLFEGAGGNTMQVTNVTVNGNLGIGNSGLLHLSGPSTVGRIDFSAANTGQFSNNNAANVFTGPFYNVAAVTNALNFLNSLNTTLGAEPGTNVSIGTGAGKTLTINVSAGTFDGSGNSVFNVTGFNTTNGNTLTINGDGIHDVVLNFTSSVNFNNQVVLNGLTSDQVLYNFVGGGGLTGGPTLQVNDNGHTHPGNMVFGDFLDPNGAISVVNTNLFGRVFGGDTHDIQIVSGDNINVPNVPDSGSTMVLLSLSLGLLAGAKRKFIS